MKGPAQLLNRLWDVAFAAPFAGAWARRMRGRVTCLLYHRVEPPDRNAFLTGGGSPAIPPGELRRELGLLRDLGARFGTFADLRGGWFPDPEEIGVIVSFDDGFRSNYEAGLEVLREAGIPAVFFQTSGLIDADDLLWEHEAYWRTRDPGASARFAGFLRGRDPALAPPGLEGRALVAHLRDRVPGPEVERLLAEARDALDDAEEASTASGGLYPTADMVRRARDEGHEIGAHGHRHYKRATIDAATFEADLIRARETLAECLGEPPKAFSYPFNSYREGDAEIVGRHFEQAATVDKRRIEREADPFHLPRFTWPGPAPNRLRRRRWLLAGSI